jgi:hypothetical protein
MQLAMDDLKPVTGSLRQIRATNRHILFEQLHVDIERTKGIAKFMSHMREQPGQQLALLLLRQPLQFLRGNGLSYRLGKDSFHERDGNTICRLGKDGNGIARRVRDVVQNLHGAGGARVANGVATLDGER